MVGQQALFETLIQKVGVVEHDIVDGLDCFELGFKFVQVGLEHLNLHVVHVVFAELKHAMAQGVSLLQDTLDVTFFCRHVLEPHLL